MVKSKAVKTEARMESDVSKYIEDVKEIPTARRTKAKGKYYEIMDSIAKSTEERRVKVLLAIIKENLKMKSAYPSFEKVLKEIAKRNGVDFSKVKEKKVKMKDGSTRIYKSYPEFDEWKEKNMQIRVSGQDIFIEKLTDKQL